MEKHVLVGISGGVDSAVVAALLKRDGYHVEGLYLDNGFLHRSREDALRVTSHLDIPLHVAERNTEFKNSVVAYFTSEYRKGNTPNPCIFCNKIFKFRFLLEEADRLGVPFVATGHYCRIEQANTAIHLLRGTDRTKDQSYFLYQLGQYELSRTLFPLGDRTKKSVRTLAETLGIDRIVAGESQEICFIPDNDYKAFIKRTLGNHSLSPGKILTADGTVVGTHQGIHSVTIGQRRGLNIASERPYYVIAINADKNEVIVGREEDQYVSGCTVSKLSWIIPGFAEKERFTAQTQIRYRHRATDTIVTTGRDDSSRRHLLFATPQKAVAPGQAAVFYDDDTVIGGGIIERGGA